MSASETQPIHPPRLRCANCERLEERIEELSGELSAAMTALARERERSNALFLSYPPQVVSAGPESSRHPLPSPSIGDAVPLRHRVVDALNVMVKRRLPVVHQAARRAFAFLASAATGRE